MAWSAEERMEIIEGLADWQERDVDGVWEADVKILTESSPTAGTQVQLQMHTGRVWSMTYCRAYCCVATEGDGPLFLLDYERIDLLVCWLPPIDARVCSTACKDGGGCAVCWRS